MNDSLGATSPFTIERHKVVFQQFQGERWREFFPDLIHLHGLCASSIPILAGVNKLCFENAQVKSLTKIVGKQRQPLIISEHQT